MTLSTRCITMTILLVLAFGWGCGTVSQDEFAAAQADESPAADTVPSRAITLVGNITVFILAIFVGFEVITKVPPTLHTPLMSGTNAITGITLVGALLATGSSQSSWGAALGFLAVILATVNVVGGFVVTGRMLAMFQRRH